MKIYSVQIIGDKFPTTYTVEATGWGTAVSRAIKQWKKRFKGSRTEKLSIIVFKSSNLLKENDHEKD